MASRLQALAERIVAAAGRSRMKCYVDAGPLPERELAWRAGLGWFGKNTMLIHPRLGSYTFIGCIVTDLTIAPDDPFDADRCGSCTRCLDACPTAALPETRVLDATRCVSYLTIEHRSEIPEALSREIGDHLFGCDICQEVCPWNVKFAAPPSDPRYAPDPSYKWPSLDEIAAMDNEAFTSWFGRSALRRARRPGLQRNARIVAANAAGAATSPKDGR